MFILRTRGNVTDATVKAGPNYVRTVTIVEDEIQQKMLKLAQKTESSQVRIGNSNSNKIDEWSDVEKNIFTKSTKSRFYLPFSSQKSDIINIECEYIESLRIVNGYYYLDIPLKFWSDYDGVHGQHLLQLKHNQNQYKYENVVKVTCVIHHANSMIVQVVYFYFVL